MLGGAQQGTELKLLGEPSTSTTTGFHGSPLNNSQFLLLSSKLQNLEEGMLMALAWIRHPPLEQLSKAKAQDYFVENGGPLCFGELPRGTVSVRTRPSPSLLNSV